MVDKWWFDAHCRTPLDRTIGLFIRLEKASHKIAGRGDLPIMLCYA